MPTLRERTSTSSAAIGGTSRSRTAARRGSSKTSAFIRSPFSLSDEHLDLVGRARGETRERAGRVVEAYAARDHALDGQAAGRDLCGDAVEVVDPVTPRADDREVVERPEHRLDGRLPDEEPCLRERATAAERCDGGVEAVRVAGAFDRDIDA